MIVVIQHGGFSQTLLNPKTDAGWEAYAYVSNYGDTVPILFLPTVTVIDKQSYYNSSESIKWHRLVRNVKKAYPYAKVAGERFLAYNDFLEGVKDQRMKKTYMKKAENDIKNEFGEQLKSLTNTQGHILIKLVDRQTASSSYNILKDYRGGTRAFFYQSFARVFGFNLKTKYDPLKNDADIERIVMMIERGTI